MKKQFKSRQTDAEGRMVRKDLSGKRFGSLFVIKEYSRTKGKYHWIYHWECACDCGNTAIVNGFYLKGGTTKSCGCIRRNQLKTHGDGGAEKSTGRSPEYASWANMIQRCYNESNPAFYYYGGRGIKVCDEWRKSYTNFLNDMGRCPEGKTLDRFPDTNGNYEPSNCRWATVPEQNRNKRDNILIHYNGETKIRGDWAKELTISSMSIRRRLEKGITFDSIYKQYKK